MPNGIYIQTEYHGKLIRKIVCNGEERWFIGSDCAVTFSTMDDCMAAIDRLAWYQNLSPPPHPPSADGVRFLFWWTVSRCIWVNKK